MAEKKKSSRKKYFAIIPVLLILFSIVVLVNEPDEKESTQQSANVPQETLQVESIKKAAILDQIHNDIPNTFFQEQAQQYLNDAGYEVDLYTTDDITVDFYKNLPAMDYQFIVLRTHGAGGGFSDSAFLFTGEKYSKTKYIQEQLLEQVHPGVPIIDQDYERVSWDEIDEIEDPMYFTVGSKMIDELMVGKFPNSVILIGGCDALANSDMAKSLIFRGASEVVGWNGLIDSFENDRVLLELLKLLLVNKVEMRDAIEVVMQNYGPFPYSTQLMYYHTEF